MPIVKLGHICCSASRGMSHSQSLGSVPEIYQDVLCMSRPLHSFLLHVHVYGHTSQMNIIITDVVCNRSKGFSVEQVEGKQLSLTFQPDALVVFRAKDKDLTFSPQDD